MILSKRIVDKIFVENKKLLYNILNDKNSFDINWFNWYYKPNIKNYKELYEIFVKYNLIGNNLNNPNTTMISKNLDYNSFFNKALGNVQFPDAMIEHAFERIYLSVIKSFPDGKYIDLSMKKDINCKNDFRRICLDNIPIIRNIIIPKIEKFIKNETVYIEFRIFNHAEYLIRNMLIKLPTWSHTVICGNQNYYHLKEICNNISDKIRIIRLDIDNLNTAQYSDLLMTKSFWNNFYGEKILLYQEDSYIFHNQIEPFLNYDWVGAPWPIHQDENINQRKYGVGNGGFSLRSKSKMIECIEKVNWKTDLILGPQLKQYMKDTNNYIIPEDVFFSKCLLEKNIGFVAPRKVAQHFSQETQPGINPLGGHNFYLADNLLRPEYNTMQLKSTEYYSTVSHRGGWNTVIKYGINNNLITNQKGVYLIDCCESFFIWDNNNIEKDWYGITHFTHNTPLHLRNLCDILLLINNHNFIKSLPFCKGLIVLSQYMYDYLIQLPIFKNIKIFNIKHPMPNDMDIIFDLNKFLSKTDYKLILLGQQLRNISSLYNIKGNIIKSKCWLSGNKELNDSKMALLRDFRFNRIIPDKEYINNIEIPYLNSYKEYDNFIVSNIIIIALYNASANNSVLEIIKTNTPAFITRIPATEEYLGKTILCFIKIFKK